MATYNVQQLADLHGVNKRTMQRRLKVLRDTGQFVKTSLGNLYNEHDLSELAFLLGFSIPQKNDPVQEQTPKIKVNWNSATSRDK